MQAGGDRMNWLAHVRNRWHELVHSNRSWTRAKQNAECHYALGTDFYRMWLDDPRMMYTCAYWKEGTRTLEEAQRNKIEHVARKLLLKPGESVVDIGSGFGGFMFHAHEKSGVRVTGVNTTTAQVEMVRAEISRRKRGGDLEVIDTDFRDARHEYDKLVSIGTLEHAGRDQLAQVVQAHARFPQARRPRHAAFHRPRRTLRDRVLHPPLRVSRRLDPEPCRYHRRDGARRPRSAGHREPAPPLRAHARRLGRALRPQLAADPRARSAG